MNPSPDFEQQIARIEGLIKTIEASDDASLREAVRQLIAALLALHGQGLTRMIELAGRDPGLIDRWLNDDVARHVLLLHGLHPVAPADRINRALDSVRPRLQSFAGDAELIDLDSAGVATVRVTGACAVLSTLREDIERAVRESAPDVGAIRYEGVRDGPVDVDHAIHLAVLRGSRGPERREG